MGKKASFHITGTQEVANGFPLKIDISNGLSTRTFVQEENDLFHCFGFAKWLEDLPKGGVSGAVILLRKYLEDRQ